MAITYPTTLDSLANPTSTDLMDNASAALDHWTQHSDANDAIEALEAKVGVNGSAVTTSHDYKLSEVTSTDKAVGKTATQTLTNKTLTSPVVNVGSDAAGDMYYRNGSGALTRLPIGTANYALTSNGTAPEWVSASTVTADEKNALAGTSGTPSSTNKYVTNDDTSGTGAVVRASVLNSGVYGNGADGAMTANGSTTYNTFSSLSANVYTLSRDIYLTDLTGSTGVSINTNGYQIYINGTLTQNGTFKIFSNGGNGGNASGVTGGAAGTGITGTTVPSTVGGAAGGNGGAATSFSAGQNGSNGSSGTASGSNALGVVGISGTATGGSSGSGATGGGAQSTGGTLGTAGALTSTPVTYPVTEPIIRNFGYYRGGSFVTFNVSGGNGGGGGGGSGGSGAGSTGGAGGGGGGSGANGGIVIVYAKTIVVNSGVTLLQAKGGNGGNGANGGTGTGTQYNGSGGGAGGVGGNGGLVILVYGTKSAAITYDVTGGSNGTSGSGSAGAGTGTAGSSGTVSATSAAGMTYEITAN